MADGGCIAMLLRPYHAWPCTTPTHDSLEPRIAFVSLRPRRRAAPPPCGSAIATPVITNNICHHILGRHIATFIADGMPMVPPSLSESEGIRASLPSPPSLQRRALAASSAAAIAPCHHHIHPAHHHSYSYHSASSRRRPPPRPLLSQTPLWQRKGACCPHTSKGLRSDQRSVGAVCEGRAVHRDAQVFGEGRGARATRRGNFLVERAVR